MLIIDAHLDLAWNALQWNRNIQHSVYTIRTGESNLSGAGRGQGTVALPEMRRGRVALCFATLLARSTGRTIQNLDYYHALEEAGEIRLITNREELDGHTSAWQQWEAQTDLAQPRLGLVISMESAD